MATSGSKSINVTDHDTLKFSWSISSQSVANNTSSVSWKMQLISDANGRISSTASKDWSVTVNGTKYSGTNTVGIAASTTKTLASGTTTITHSADGTKTFSYSFSQEFAITFSGSSIGTKSSSGTGTLDTIPRKSTLSVKDGTLGSSQTLTVTRNSSSFTHTITATCGSASSTVCTKSSSTSISFTPPLIWASQNTTGTSVSVKYTITTYNGSTSIGSNSYTKSCSIPSSIKPSVSLTVSDANGYYSTYGGYVQNKSKFNVKLTASGSYGSSISSYKTTANGGTYTASSFTTGVITNSGTLTISSTVTDSRGRVSNTASKTDLKVLPYSAPKISNFTVTRYKKDDKDYAKISFNSSVTDLSKKNTATYTIKYKKTTDKSYSAEMPIELQDYKNVYVVSGGTYDFEVESTSSYNISLEVSDNFTGSSPIKSDITLSTESKLISFYKEGKGLALGKVAEYSDTFECAFKTTIKKQLNVESTLNGFTGGKIGSQTLTNEGYIAFYDDYNSTTRKGFIGPVKREHFDIYNDSTGYIRLRTKAQFNNIAYFGNGTTYSVDVSGHANFNNITAGGTLTTTGATTLKSTLAVTGNTTVGGTLTTTGATTLKSTLAVTSTATFNNDATFKTESYFQKSSYLSNACYVRGYTSKNAESVLIGMGSGDWIAVGQADYILGLRGSSVRLGSSSGTVVTSDRNLKKDIEDIDDRYIEFFKKLRPVTYKYEIGRTGRPHIGFIAQEVEEALKDSELTTADFAGICVDDVVYTEENKDDEYDDMNYAYNKGLKQVYSLRYEEFISLNSKMIQELIKENTILKNEIQQIKELLKER